MLNLVVHIVTTGLSKCLDNTDSLKTSGMSCGVVWSMQIVLEELNMELAWSLPGSQPITSTQNIAQDNGIEWCNFVLYM